MIYRTKPHIEEDLPMKKPLPWHVIIPVAFLGQLPFAMHGIARLSETFSQPMAVGFIFVEISAFAAAFTVMVRKLG